MTGTTERAPDEDPKGDTSKGEVTKDKMADVRAEKPMTYEHVEWDDLQLLKDSSFTGLNHATLRNVTKLLWETLSGSELRKLTFFKPKEDNVNTFVARFIHTIIKFKEHDEDALDLFRESFYYWSETQWDLCTPKLRTAVTKTMRWAGVYSKPGTKHSMVFAQYIATEVCPTWTDEQIEEHAQEFNPQSKQLRLNGTALDYQPASVRMRENDAILRNARVARGSDGYGSHIRDSPTFALSRQRVTLSAKPSPVLTKSDTHPVNPLPPAQGSDKAISEVRESFADLSLNTKGGPPPARRERDFSDLLLRTTATAPAVKPMTPTAPALTTGRTIPYDAAANNYTAQDRPASMSPEHLREQARIDAGIENGELPATGWQHRDYSTDPDHGQSRYHNPRKPSHPEFDRLWDVLNTPERNVTNERINSEGIASKQRLEQQARQTWPTNKTSTASCCHSQGCTEHRHGNGTQQTEHMTDLNRPTGFPPVHSVPSMNQIDRRTVDLYRNLPPAHIQTEPVPPTSLKNFTMMWKDTNNYTGRPLDILDDKILRMMEMASHVGLEPQHFRHVLPFILSGDAQEFYMQEVSQLDTFREAYVKIKNEFDNKINRETYHNLWTTTSLNTVRNDSDNRDKKPLEILETLFKTLKLVQRALGSPFTGDEQLRATIIRACRGERALEPALFRPAGTSKELMQDLKTALHTSLLRGSQQSFIVENDGQEDDTDPQQQLLLERKFNWSRKPGYNSAKTSYPNRNFKPAMKTGGVRRQGNKRVNFRKNRCWICKEEGCWSTRHTPEEQMRHKRQYFGDNLTPDQEGRFQQLVYDEEGEDPEANNNEEEENTHDDQPGTIQQLVYETNWTRRLQEDAFYHRLTKEDIYTRPRSEEPSQFSLEARYSERFQGILPDTGAAAASTVGRCQFEALCKERPDIKLNTDTAGSLTINFGKGSATSQGTVTLDTGFGMIDFHVMDSMTPFLLSLEDMNRLQVECRQVCGHMFRVTDGHTLPIHVKFGHPWFYPPNPHGSTAYFTETELRRLHRRFGHPAVDRLYRLLDKVGQTDETTRRSLQQIEKFCHQCQVHAPAPQRFTVALKDDIEFNYKIEADVNYIPGRPEPILHVIDSATGFNAAAFLPSMSAQDLWTTLRRLWIDVYLGPPDIIVHDAGLNFDSALFRGEARLMGISVKQVPVEAPWSIGKLEGGHKPMVRAYQIIEAEMPPSTPKEAILQMAVKAVNDTAGPDGLVPTLLVFGAYPRLNEDSAPSPTMAQRAKAVEKAMKALRRHRAERDVKRALAARNGPNIEETITLPVNSEVIVYRKDVGWKGPYNMLAITGRTVTVDIPNGPADFRITHVRPYHRDETTMTPEVIQPDQAKTVQMELPTGSEEHSDRQRDSTYQPDITWEPDYVPPPPPEIAPRPRGRPPGSKNKKDHNDSDDETPPPPPVVTRRRGRPPGARNKPRQLISAYTYDGDTSDSSVSTSTTGTDKPSGTNTWVLSYSSVFISRKEEAAIKLAEDLRRQGKITTPGEPFELAVKTEINDLVERGVFRFEEYDEAKHGQHHIFKARVVYEVKDLSGNPREKARFVLQGHNDKGKESILTTSPTIQRSSQRLIIALIATLLLLGFFAWLRDITQAYTQSKTKLKRHILAWVPDVLSHMFDQYKKWLMVIMIPLYGLAEAGVYWFHTYLQFHLINLGMTASTFDPCLLISTDNSKGTGFVAMQTDDTLAICDDEFAAEEEAQLKKEQFVAKPKTKLTAESPIEFNGSRISLEGRNVLYTAKEQADNIEIVDLTLPTELRKAEYKKQRARGAWLASVSQPEAAYALSAAAQSQEDPTDDDYTRLNKVLAWQKANAKRGLRYIPFPSLGNCKLYVFTDGSFANNKDMTSQLGFVIVLGYEDNCTSTSFTLHGNIVHWSSTKCKRVTRSVLASEIYGMVGGFDIGFTMATTLKKITTRLGMRSIPLVVCTDSYSLYDCLVKLGTTTEKRLMIDIMALRDSYENREIDELRWIHGDDNPADAMTKGNPNSSLATLVETNTLSVRVEGFVERPQQAEEETAEDE